MPSSPTETVATRGVRASPPPSRSPPSPTPRAALMRSFGKARARLLAAAAARRRVVRAPAAQDPAARGADARRRAGRMPALRPVHGQPAGRRAGQGRPARAPRRPGRRPGQPAGAHRQGRAPCSPTTTGSECSTSPQMLDDWTRRATCAASPPCSHASPPPTTTRKPRLDHRAGRSACRGRRRGRPDGHRPDQTGAAADAPARRTAR